LAPEEQALFDNCEQIVLFSGEYGRVFKNSITLTANAKSLS
jgi:hypothetical protein